MPQFPLLKYSKATSPVGVLKYTWNHATHDLALVFDSGSSGFSQHLSMLKVFQGGTAVDAVDLRSKIQEANQFAEQAREAGVILKAEQLHTTVLHRRTACSVAIKYQLDDRMTRRIQLRFCSVQDFDEVLGILKGMQCTLIAIDPQDGQSQDGDQSRPSTAASAMIEHTRKPTFLAPQPGPPSSVGSGSHSRTANADERQLQLDVTPPVESRSSFAVSNRHFSRQLPTIAERQQLEQQSEPFMDRPMTALDRTMEQYADDASVVAESARPSTAPIQQAPSMLPPRRLLPFQKPGSNYKGHSNAGSSSSRPPSSGYPLPPLPIPSFVNKPSPKGTPPTSKRAQAEPRVGKTTPAGSSIWSNYGKANSATKPPPSAGSEPITGTPPSKEHNFRSSPPLNLNRMAQPKPPNEDTSTPSELVVEGDVSSAQDQVGAESLKLIDRSMTGDLAEYAALPYAERMSMVESMIIELAADPDFLTLCEDVNGCWQRIGLELS
ncbi:hypothetical protein EJ06DRAFT_583362 [Trichodelitschia bisporula]|uniref:Uncharacterized protein n=1 Tax=Trichodelitschia bisporula TaxID=703511 RepID=A0A6G1HRR9_9PEZI|nr:hypothetical protein EJ06DRAFT_583362 [Trichodelitschia bisporula]